MCRYDSKGVTGNPNQNKQNKLTNKQTVMLVKNGANLITCLFVSLFCFVFSNLFIFIVIVMRWCHHKHVWRFVKLKPSVHGVKYLFLIIFNPPHRPRKLTARGGNFLPLKTHLVTPPISRVFESAVWTHSSNLI